jgi:hypothetical protein
VMKGFSAASIVFGHFFSSILRPLDSFSNLGNSPSFTSHEFTN